MRQKVTLTESPRDAFQGLPGFIPTQTKAQYLRSLIQSGFPRIDFGSFVSPKAVPQMEDTGQVLDLVRPDLGKVYLIAIVPNLKGLETAIRAGGIQCAGFALSVSETFQQRNFRQSIDQAWSVVERLVERSAAANMDLLVYLSMAFGNPYGDPWSASQVSEFSNRLESIGVRQISLADTVGMASPGSICELFSVCSRNLSEAQLGVHLHGRSNLWQESIMAAFSAGCRKFDSALLGMGGCPFASDALVGNIPTEGLVRKFEQMGVDTGLELSALQRPLSLAQKIMIEYSAARPAG